MSCKSCQTLKEPPVCKFCCGLRLKVNTNIDLVIPYLSSVPWSLEERVNDVQCKTGPCLSTPPVWLTKDGYYSDECIIFPFQSDNTKIGLTKTGSYYISFNVVARLQSSGPGFAPSFMLRLYTNGGTEYRNIVPGFGSLHNVGPATPTELVTGFAYFKAQEGDYITIINLLTVNQVVVPVLVDASVDPLVLSAGSLSINLEC